MSRELLEADLPRAFIALVAAIAILLCAGIGWVVAAANGIVPADRFPLPMDLAVVLDGEGRLTLTGEPWLPPAGLVLIAIVLALIFVLRRRGRAGRELLSEARTTDAVSGDDLQPPPSNLEVNAKAPGPVATPEPGTVVAGALGPSPATSGATEPETLPVAPHFAEQALSPLGQAAPDAGVSEGHSGLAVTLVAMGRQAAEEGDRETTYRLMRQALEKDSRNVEAWIWRAAAAEAIQESLVCLKTALLLDPENAKAKQGLASLQARMAEDKGER